MKQRSTLLALLMLGGCTVGPDYERPAMDAPAHYLANDTADTTSGADLARWWDGFGDPLMVSAIDRALAANTDMGIASARIRAARLQEVIARAGGLPSVSASAGTSTLKFSKNAGFSSLLKSLTGSGQSGGGVAAPGDSITTFDAGFDAAWELDLFGGNRRASEAAAAQTESAIWSARDVQLSLAAEVADSYIKLRGAQQVERLAQTQLDRQQHLLDIANHSAQAGTVPAADALRPRAQVAIAKAALEQARAEIGYALVSLGLLMDSDPVQLRSEFADNGKSSLPAFPDIPAGLPSELLERRPDVRTAERNLAAATARIGIAEANRLPKISLTGAAQLISSALTNLLSSDSLQLAGGATAGLSLFDGGSGKARAGIAREEAQIAALAYRKTALQAFADTNRALVAIGAERRRNVQFASAEQDARAAANTARARYQAGLTNIEPVLESEIALVQAESSRLGSDVALRQGTIALAKALGGGWSASPDQ